MVLVGVLLSSRPFIFIYVLQARGGGAIPRVSRYPTIERFFVAVLTEPAVELPLLYPVPTAA